MIDEMEVEREIFINEVLDNSRSTSCIFSSVDTHPWNRTDVPPRASGDSTGSTQTDVGLRGVVAESGTRVSST
jgi:hypothetical protein